MFPPLSTLGCLQHVRFSYRLYSHKQSEDAANFVTLSGKKKTYTVQWCASTYAVVLFMLAQWCVETRLRYYNGSAMRLWVLAVTLGWRLEAVRGITCFCLGHCPDDQLNGTCTAPPGAPCFAGNFSLQFKKTSSVLRNHEILVWIRIRGSKHLNKGSGCGSGSSFEGTFTSFFKDKKS